MNNPFQGIRWKILWLFFISASLAVGTSFVLINILLWLIRSDLLTPRVMTFIRKVYDDVGMVPILSMTGAVLFVAYVMILSWGHVSYIVKITEAVKLLANGNLDHRVHVKSQDELGKLASHINQMAGQLQASIEEERLAVKGKNELVTNVSHDLRTPLTSIMGYLQLINEDRYKDEIELRHYIDVAYAKSLRLNRLVNDLFEYTSMGYGQTVLVRQNIDLRELIGQLAADFNPQLTSFGMALSLTLPENKVMINADGDKLMRTFENLISNAIKYGREGKRINIDLTEYKDKIVIIRVVNYGIPIPQQDQPYLFERFYRGEKSRSDETGGSGLGLAIVKSIIDLHGGSITLSSDKRETVFEVRLPKNDAQA